MTTPLSLTPPCSPDQVDAFLSRPTAGVLKTVVETEGDFLILGAGGKMGGTLAYMLREAIIRKGSSQRVIAVSRFSNAAAREEFEKAGVETISADLLEREAVEALPDVPNVFFLAGFKFGSASAPELTWAMNAVVPAYVADRFRNSRIVAFSTGCVYPFVSVASGGSREEDGPSPQGDYANSCAARENVFIHFSKKHGNALCLYRLNYSVEPRYGVLVDLGKKVLAGEEIDVSMGYVNVIWQRDAVARAIQCLEVAATGGTVMNITGPEIVSVRHLAERLAKVLGCEARIVGKEAETAWLNNAGLSNKLWGYPETSLDQIIEWTAAWLREGGATLDKPTRFETRDGKY